VKVKQVNRILPGALAAGLVLCWTAPALAAGPPAVTAKSALVMDAETGRTLYAKAPDRLHPPASTVKVMTGLLALEKVSPRKEVSVSAAASREPASRLGLHLGDRIAVQDLLYGLLLKSANDASVALAETAAGDVDRFVKLMNEKARALGARKTVFKNPSGLPARGQVTTASDLARIFRAALRNEAFVKIAETKHRLVTAVSEDSERRRIMVRNHNRLLWEYEGAGPGKTGYTVASRHTYVGEVEENGRKVIVVVLGSRRPWQDVRTLVDYGFVLAAAAHSKDRVASVPSVAGGERG
jgi:D-alanyl-D-alanine carboxypeptidase (penicillin-binding protein 5/6)